MFNNKVQEIAGAYLNLLLFESTVNLGTTGLSDSQLECWSLEISDARLSGASPMMISMFDYPLTPIVIPFQVNVF
jgi:hypothetical protein